MKSEVTPLSDSEHLLLEEGKVLFNQGKYWHAHEAWEDLWNCLKSRNCASGEILLIQGLIQTSALLYHHEKKNHNGICKQWEKLERKLSGWGTVWGIDIESHLMNIKLFVNDEGIVDIDPRTVQL